MEYQNDEDKSTLEKFQLETKNFVFNVFYQLIGDEFFSFSLRIFFSIIELFQIISFIFKPQVEEKKIKYI